MADENQTQPVHDPPEWLTLNDAASHHGVSAYTIRRWIREGRLPAEKRPSRYGDQLFIPASALAIRESGEAEADSLRSTATSQRAQALEPTQPEAIVDRDAQLGLLRTLLDSAAAGRGRVAIVSGDAGIGKTTIVRQCVRDAARARFQVASGHCYDLEATPPYGPWRELAGMLAISEGSARDLADPLTSAASLQEQQAQIWATITACAQRQPLLLVLEDMHWSDGPSVELLRVIARRVATEPILLLVTHRDVDLTHDHPLFRLLPYLVREAGAERIQLRPFNRDGVTRLLSKRYSLSESDQTQLSQYLLRYAEGNPFFTAELLHELVSKGILRPSGSDWALSDLAEFQLPPLIRQVIERRLEPLTSQARDQLQVAAIIGEEVPIDLWQAVTGSDDDTLIDVAEQAIAAGVLVEMTDRPAFHFRHALIRQALHDRMILLRRRGWHRRVAEVVEAGPAPDPDVVAYHYAQASDPRAVNWLIQAGRRAAISHAYQVTTRRYEQALEFMRADDGQRSERGWLLCELSEAYRYTEPRRSLDCLAEAESIAEQLDDAALRAVLLRSRSHIRGFLGEHALDDLLDAVAVYDALPAAEQQRILTSPLGYSVIQGTYAQRLVYYGKYSLALQMAREYLAMTQERDDETTGQATRFAQFAIAKAAAALGQPEESREAFAAFREQSARVGSAYMVALSTAYEYSMVLHTYYADRPDERRRYIDLVDRAYKDSLYGLDTSADRILRLYPALILDGRWDEARMSAEAMYANEAVRIDCATALAQLDMLQGQPERAWKHITDCMPSGPVMRPGTTYFLEFLDLQDLAVTLALDTGDADHAAAWITAFSEWIAWSEMKVRRPRPELAWARYHFSLGQSQEARHHAQRALELANDPYQPLYCLAAHRALARIAIPEGRLEEATHHLDAALAIALACEAPWEIAVTHIVQAERLIAAGRPSDAALLLQQSRETAERLGARPLMEQTDSLIASIARQPATPPSRQTGPATPLSPRELEVLLLVARGFTDAEVAEQLYISPRTVSGHLQSIYNKLGISSRTAATAFAYEQGLV